MHLETSTTMIHISRQRERERGGKQRIDFSGFCHALAEHRYFIFKNKQPDYYVCITRLSKSSTRHSMLK
jgi:hypothetical protein